jgi:hypothetical protein
MEEKRNYWKEEEENLLKDWADKAQCYELLHSKSHAIYKRRHAYFVIPVIIISTLTGTANFAQDKISDTNSRNIFVMVTGGLNIGAAIISTISQFLKISEMNEGHRVASYSWGKFYRHIKTELAKHPLDRINPKDMLSMAKEEYDRLLEISPMIPKLIIQEFNKTFLDNSDISKPEICDVIVPTNVFQMTKEDRQKMADQYNPVIEEKNEDKEETNDDEVIEIPDEDAKLLENPVVDKFKESYFKINHRYPSLGEIKVSLGNLFQDDNEESQI